MDKQTIVRIINQDILMNANVLMQRLSEEDSEIYQDFLDSITPAFDTDGYLLEVHEAACRDDLIELCGSTSLDAFRDLWESSEYEIDELADNLGVDSCDYELEVYEYYFISEWFYNKLQEIGYPTGEIAGYYPVMCRTTTGQSISEDYFWSQIKLHNI